MPEVVVLHGMVFLVTYTRTVSPGFAGIAQPIPVRLTQNRVEWRATSYTDVPENLCCFFWCPWLSIPPSPSLCLLLHLCKCPGSCQLHLWFGLTYWPNIGFPTILNPNNLATSNCHQVQLHYNANHIGCWEKLQSTNGVMTYSFSDRNPIILGVRQSLPTPAVSHIHLFSPSYPYSISTSTLTPIPTHTYYHPYKS